ncbi:MAG TPA: hypothetical protein PKX28_08340, partial [Candidatus Hydrogenedentes bacterium]|nr:hypothetical protein [Candidatus Hydrogenedentota bacterium]
MNIKNNHALPGIQGYGIAALALGIGLAMTGLALLLWPGSAVEPALSPAHPRPSGRPNIVLIVIDALRADRLNAQRNGLPV